MLIAGLARQRYVIPRRSIEQIMCKLLASYVISLPPLDKFQQF
jgi:hypothetical protein